MNERLHPNPIDTILNSNWNEFEQWVQKEEPFQMLELPDDLANVFIPRRTLELANNPNNVHTLFTEKGPRNLGLLLYESLPSPISDSTKLNVLMEEKQKQGVTVLPSSPTQVEEGIDYQHVLNYNLIRSGKLGLQDKILIRYLANIPEGYDSVVETRNYYDRVEMQRQGIGTSFYDRLENVLKELGFNYLTGHIISPHPEFFLKRRPTYDSLPDEVKQELPEYYSITPDPNLHWTIKTL
ncbi:MAG TPA: hypothetical protein PLD54_01685 [Candidatus Levybacteria bacterium]|nr:hypothetical protein [Candidatus Levybacteria bacterium]